MSDHPKTFRRWHKAAALAGALWFVLMGLSGIWLNHPDLLASWDLPRRWLPGYSFENWNRNSLRGAATLAGREFLYGEAGVWERVDGEARPFSQGLPASAYLVDTRALATLDEQRLAAGTRGGLFVRGLDDPAWSRLPLPGDPEDGAVTDVRVVEGRLLVLTRSALYAAPLEEPARLAPVSLSRAPGPETFSLFRLFFEMHPGRLWGLPGRLLVDASGVLLVGFSVTGLWFWWRKRRGTLARGRGGKAAREGFKRHVRWGLLTLPLLAFVALTGIFQRPPFLAAVAWVDLPAALYPAPRPASPWHDKFRKMLGDTRRRTLVVSTADGVFEAPFDAVFAGGAQLSPVTVGQPPVSVMGATVFMRRERDSAFLVGSMSGLYYWDPDTGLAWDAFTGNPPGGGSPVGANRVMGFAEVGGSWVWADYGRGVIGPDGRPAPLPMPAELADGGRISLWHALFEAHNGRIFGFALGEFSWIVIPLGGLALLLELYSGLKLRRRR